MANGWCNQDVFTTGETSCYNFTAISGNEKPLVHRDIDATSLISGLGNAYQAMTQVLYL